MMQMYLTGFVPCMTAGLAYYLAIKNAPERVQMLKMLYEDELQRALSRRWFFI